MISAIHSLIFKDFWLKLFSLALALLIWFTIGIAIDKEGTQNRPLGLLPVEQRTLNELPVIVLSSAEDVRSLQVRPKTVDVTIQGDPKILRALRASDIRVLVDLTGIGETQSLNKRIEVSMPAGITLVQVEPQDVQVISPSKN